MSAPSHRSPPTVSPTDTPRSGQNRPSLEPHLPSSLEAKRQARRLREGLAAGGTSISHGRALEIVAHQHGFRDWNAFCAAAMRMADPPWAPGDRVRGRYLSIPVTATVLRATREEPDWFCLVIRLDEAVDVIKFQGLSAFRRRITARIGPAGHTRERTSDGVPHLVLEKLGA